MGKTGIYRLLNDASLSKEKLSSMRKFFVETAEISIKIRSDQSN